MKKRVKVSIKCNNNGKANIRTKGEAIDVVSAIVGALIGCINGLEYEDGGEIKCTKKAIAQGCIDNITKYCL
ncbi:MAG: hypothetical protein LKJ75_02420 [Clostridia bacterium]|jgi:hypothetical protein|nr:hypothetical protein [Clostridia bacterium]MCI2014038.1 hypothetical protein [Clostridia bacterium]